MVTSFELNKTNKALLLVALKVFQQLLLGCTGKKDFTKP